MSERPNASPMRKAGREEADPADPASLAKLQQAAKLANDNCDRAMALAHRLSVQLRAAEERINELEAAADGEMARLRSETETA